MQLIEAALDLFRTEDVLASEQSFHREKPPTVVARSDVVRSIHQLDFMAVLIEVPNFLGIEHLGDAKDVAFPVRVKDWLVLLLNHQAESVQTAHVMNAVHLQPQ